MIRCMRSVLTGLICASVFLVGLGAANQETGERRIKAARGAQYEEMARVLNLGEIALRVTVSGEVDVIAAGKYCGMINLPAATLDSDSYKQSLFSQLDELLARETGYRIGDFADVFFFFDSDVKEETLTKQRDVFQRYEPCYYNCCTAEHAYSCCPSRISPWLLRVPVSPSPNWAEVVRCIQYAKVHEIAHVNVLLISDGSAQDFGPLGGEQRVGSASLVAWLSTNAVVTAVYELRLGVTPDDITLTGSFPTPQDQERALTIVILSHDRSRHGALAEAVEDAVLREVTERLGNPFVLLLSFAEPSVSSIGLSLTGSPMLPTGRGVVLVSARSQSGQVLEEVLIAIRSQRASHDKLQAFAVILSLRVYGFVVYSYCVTYPVVR